MQFRPLDRTTVSRLTQLSAELKHPRTDASYTRSDRVEIVISLARTCAAVGHRMGFRLHRLRQTRCGGAAELSTAVGID